MSSNIAAFPQALTLEHEFNGSEGMTLRQYFAARAPHQIPEWFAPTGPSMPKAPDLPALGDKARSFLMNWKADPIFDLGPAADEWLQHALISIEDHAALRVYEPAWTAYVDAHAAWERDRLRQRIAQWPWAWADLVLSEPKS